jgi:hypothetical protein
MSFAISQIDLREIRLPLREPFHISSGYPAAPTNGIGWLYHLG